MSDEARAYVKLLSPFRNSTWWVHYVLADMANVAHNYELYWHVDKMIQEWPVLTADTIGRARKTLIDEGYLEPLQAEAPGRPPRYRFVFLGAEIMAIEPQNADRSVVKMPTVGAADNSLVNTKRKLQTPGPNRAGARELARETWNALDVKPLGSRAFYSWWDRHEEALNAGATPDQIRKAAPFAGGVTQAMWDRALNVARAAPRGTTKTERQDAYIDEAERARFGGR
jgi:hypothetical protein